MTRRGQRPTTLADWILAGATFLGRMWPLGLLWWGLSGAFDRWIAASVVAFLLWIDGYMGDR